jgi:hypothetical protein
MSNWVVSSCDFELPLSRCSVGRDLGLSLGDLLRENFPASVFQYRHGKLALIQDAAGRDLDVARTQMPRG